MKPSTPAGVLELLPAEQAIHDSMLDTIRRGSRRFGFAPIETPVFERAEVLLSKGGGDTEKQVYFVQSAGARSQGEEPDLALRFDLTVPLARYVAEHEHGLIFPFRCSQVQRVYRGERPQRGRYREFYQCDIDVIDRDELSLRHDAEVAAAMIATLEDLAIGEFSVKVNNRRLMRSLLEGLGVPDPAWQTDVLREIDKLDRRDDKAVEGSLIANGMSRDGARRLLDLTTVRAVGADGIRAALSELGDLGRGGRELAEVATTLEALGAPDHRYALDLSIARGLDYYTGTVYETVLDDHPELGSICSGGRYDDLAGQYTRTRLPGVGMSIGFTRLFWQLREAGLLPSLGAGTIVSVTLMDDDGLGYSFEITNLLRGADIATETCLVPAKLGKQLKTADRAGIPFAVIAGDDERSHRTATIRDLRTGDQAEVGLDNLVEHIASRMKPGPVG